MSKISKKENARRKAIKSMAIGGAAVTTAKTLPEHWGKPIVDGILLPGHANMTGSSSGSSKGGKGGKGKGGS